MPDPPVSSEPHGSRSEYATFRSDEPAILIGGAYLDDCSQAFRLTFEDGWNCALIAKYLGNPDFLSPLEDINIDLSSENFELEMVGFYFNNRIRKAENLPLWKKESIDVKRDVDKHSHIQDELNTQRFNLGLDELPRRFGEDWSDDEDNYIKYKFKQGLPCDSIANEHERTSWEVKRRLTLLDMHRLNLSNYELTLNSGFTLLNEKGWPIGNLNSFDYWESSPVND